VTFASSLMVALLEQERSFSSLFGFRVIVRPGSMGRGVGQWAHMDASFAVEIQQNVDVSVYWDTDLKGILPNIRCRERKGSPIGHPDKYACPNRTVARHRASAQAGACPWSATV
jgi:hypothetical protein